MRFMGILLFFFLLFPSFLNAAASYVQVTQTTTKSKLRIIKSKLNKMGLKMVFKRSGSRYLVYSGPYKNLKSASYAVKKIKRYFPYAKVVGKKNKKLKPIEKSTQNKQISTTKTLRPIKTKKINGFFTGLALAYSSAPSNQSGTIKDIVIPSNSGISFSLEGGYHFENGLSFSLAYMKFNAGDLVFDNTYGVANYRFSSFGGFVPYFGVLAGYSSLVWNISPIKDVSSASSNNSESFFTGSQTGILYKGFDIISILIGYQCIFMSHTTNISNGTDTSKLEHKALHSLQIGIQYNF